MTVNKTTIYVLLANSHVTIGKPNSYRQPDHLREDLWRPPAPTNGWVEAEHIEQTEWCPYSLKTARIHRRRYLEKDPFIEVLKRHGGNKYRLSRDPANFLFLKELLSKAPNVAINKEPYLLHPLENEWYYAMIVNPHLEEKRLVSSSLKKLENFYEPYLKYGEFFPIIEEVIEGKKIRWQPIKPHDKLVDSLETLEFLASIIKECAEYREMSIVNLNKDLILRNLRMEYRGKRSDDELEKQAEHIAWTEYNKTKKEEEQLKWRKQKNV